LTERFDALAARPGRVVVGRLLPGSDLIRGLEAVCDSHGFRSAAILAVYGSLSSAGFKVLKVPPGESRPRLMPHRIEARVEFMGGQGLVCETPTGDRDTHLHGSVSGADGVVLGGHFVAGENPVYNNMDIVLQELHDVVLVREHDSVTDSVEMRVLPDVAGTT
jgi:predicted DNA-binding protein with PD1-like motif